MVSEELAYALNLIRTDRGLRTQHISVLAVSYIVFFFLLIVSIITMMQCTRAVQVVQKIPEVSRSSATSLIRFWITFKRLLHPLHQSR
uniref:Uncharacterized protein n=1 Tax=Anopheles merus TaxID=30066 RepID=A0A182V6V6_ANOME